MLAVHCCAGAGAEGDGREEPPQAGCNNAENFRCEVPPSIRRGYCRRSSGLSGQRSRGPQKCHGSRSRGHVGRLGNKNGVLASLYSSRKQFDVVEEKIVAVDVVPETEHPFRTIVTKSSILGGQGFKKCNCKGRCMTNKCTCRKAGEKCKSQCHGGGPCGNK
ncbi:hypothetical protein FOCC_FOCC014238 [Frankliniella occidentalis]|nr:hypothetical protein FOCC_FOCC014238 [Frankliniella occidentalis]